MTDLTTQLKDQLQQALDALGSMPQEIEQLRAENEKLKEYWLSEQKARLRQTDLVETWKAVKCKHEIEQLRAENERLLYAIAKGGFDLSYCRVCGELVACLPDGLPCCKDCAERG